MRIDEMIDTLNASVLSNRAPNGMGVRIFQCDADKIIVAIKAAQLMHDTIEAFLASKFSDYLDDDVRRHLTFSLNPWKEATKDDEE